MEQRRLKRRKIDQDRNSRQARIWALYNTPHTFVVFSKLNKIVQGCFDPVHIVSYLMQIVISRVTLQIHWRRRITDHAANFWTYIWRRHCFIFNADNVSNFSGDITDTLAKENHRPCSEFLDVHMKTSLHAQGNVVGVVASPRFKPLQDLTIFSCVFWCQLKKRNRASQG